MIRSVREGAVVMPVRPPPAEIRVQARQTPGEAPSRAFRADAVEVQFRDDRVTTFVGFALRTMWCLRVARVLLPVA